MTSEPLAPLLLAAAPKAGKADPSGYANDAAEHLAEVAGMHPVLHVAVVLAMIALAVGMVLCLWRVVRGPGLPDRVLAADLLSLHVVGLVIVLTIYLGDMVFFDAALAVGILGFVSTVGFSQYIHATAGRPGFPGTPPEDGGDATPPAAGTATAPNGANPA